MQTVHPSLEVMMEKIRGGLIVSCQASDDDPFRDSEMMARFADAAVRGGAVGIRANGADDIRAIRRAVDVPVIGIDKQVASDGRILITPSFEGARSLVEAGADLIAVDCTQRGQRYGALQRVARIRREFGPIVITDIATEDEAIAAARAGAVMVLSTMRGYTDETVHIKEFQPQFISVLVQAVNVPVLAEGRIAHPEQALAALEAGATAVIVGTAITRPEVITRNFDCAIRSLQAKQEAARYVLAFDIGGTNIKYGIVSANGELLSKNVVPTPLTGGDAIVEILKGLVRTESEAAKAMGNAVNAIGVSTAGWVDRASGRLVYGTGTLPGWMDVPLRMELASISGLPTFVENDGHAFARGEGHFGAAKGIDDFICFVLGTGVGGGCYIKGKLVDGAHSLGNALGHIVIRPGGIPCKCGKAGCLEAYANAAALVRAADCTDLQSAQQVIAAARAGHVAARAAIRQCAEALADGCACVVHVLDPSMILLSGGVMENNPMLLADFREALHQRVIAWEMRQLTVRASSLGYYGGVLGAAALALQSLSSE